MKTFTVQINTRRIPNCSSNHIQTYKISNDRRQDKASHQKLRRSIGSSWIGPIINGSKKERYIYAIHQRTKSLVRLTELKDVLSQKITPKREGLFEIEEVLGPVTYRLKLLESWKIHNVFHAILLRPYIENEVHGGNFLRPIPELLDGEEVYEVESIMKHRWRGQGYQYYIKWKGYPITEATWENEMAFSDDSNMLEQYKKWHQLTIVTIKHVFHYQKSKIDPYS